MKTQTTKSIIEATTDRSQANRCITRIVINGKKKTRGWQVRVIRSGMNVNEFFSDVKWGGRAVALSEAMFFRDAVIEKLKPIPRSELARRVTRRNTSGIPGVRRGTQTIQRRGKVYDYIVWTASGSPAPNRRKTRHFYVSGSLDEEAAREAAIAQRLRWEKDMERNELKRSRGRLPR